MSNYSVLCTPNRLADALASDDPPVVFDCRFSLADTAAGRSAYEQGHIPGAHYLHLDEDLSGRRGDHGGRHPLPDAEAFAQLMAHYGVGLQSPVVVYDDQRFAFASRAWWLLRSLGYCSPQVLDGGYSAWVAAGHKVQASEAPQRPVAPAQVGTYSQVCDHEGMLALMATGATVIDAREERRYLGLEEPIDPVAGHIPGALNLPWQGVTDDAGFALEGSIQRERWLAVAGDSLDTQPVVVYCGSGVTACVNLLAAELAGLPESILYAGSWSDWCSYLEVADESD